MATSSSKLGELPISVVHQMCRHLNVEGAGVKNWKDLIAQPQVSYDVFAADSFAHSGQRPHTSPAEQVINDFIAQGITVDELYVMLGGIQALACMDLLKPHVSRAIVDSQRSSRNHGDHGPLPFLPDVGVASLDSTPSPEEHPKYGVLPSVAPPTSDQLRSDVKGYNDGGYHGNSFHDNRFQDSSFSMGSSRGSSAGYHVGPLPPISHLPPNPPTSHLPEALPTSQLPPPPLHHLDYHPASVEGGVSVGVVDQQLPLHGTAQVLINAGIPAIDSSQAVAEQPYYYDNQPRPLDPQYSGHQQQQQQQQQIYEGGYVSHPPYMGHMTRTASDGSTNLSSEGSGYVSSGQRSVYVSSESTSGPSSLDQSSRGQMSSNNTSTSHGSQYDSREPRSNTNSVPSVANTQLAARDNFGGLNILHFSYAELSEATGGFTRGLIGIGSFGTVFKAEVRHNGPYAVKKLHSERELGEHCVLYDSFHRESFQQELQLLTRYHHRNILSLVAYSNDGYLPCLVYDFMEYGSLSECLQENRGVRLGWERRLRIASAVADALHFLHTVNAPNTTLVHGDVKSANILLDKHFAPKLSDFGLACELSTRSSRSSTTFSSRSAVVRGTMAYMAPEFVRNRKLTTRTDVYAYGVVLLELHTGLPALSEDHTQEEEPVLTERLYELLEDSDAHRSDVVRVADERADWPEEIGVALFDIITVCLHKRMSKRMPIKQVLDQLATLLPP